MAKYQVDPDKLLARALTQASKKVGDLTIPFTLISKMWFQGNKAIYRLKGPGKYTDLTPGYQKTKRRNFGFVYPILRATGRLEESITNPASSESINLVIDKTTLVMGSSVPYATFLQTGTKRMAARPYVLIGAEQTGPDEFNERKKAFAQILEDYVDQVWQQAKGGK